MHLCIKLYPLIKKSTNCLFGLFLMSKFELQITTTMTTHNSDPKKTIDNLANDQVDGHDVKGGGLFGPPEPGDNYEDGNGPSNGDYLPHEHPPHPEGEIGNEHDIAPMPWDITPPSGPIGGPFGGPPRP
jgi:hypothetical protein